MTRKRPPQKHELLEPEAFAAASPLLRRDLFDQTLWTDTRRFALALYEGRPAAAWLDGGWRKDSPLTVALRRDAGAARLILRKVASAPKAAAEAFRSEWRDTLYSGYASEKQTVALRRILKAFDPEASSSAAWLVSDLSHALINGRFEAALAAAADLARAPGAAEALTTARGCDFPEKDLYPEAVPRPAPPGKPNPLDREAWAKSLNDRARADSWNRRPVDKTGPLAFLRFWSEALASDAFASHPAASELSDRLAAAADALWALGPVSSPNDYAARYLSNPAAGRTVRTRILSEIQERRPDEAFSALRPLILEACKAPRRLLDGEMLFDAISRDHAGCAGLVHPAQIFAPGALGQSPGVWSLAYGGELFKIGFERGERPSKSAFWIADGALGKIQRRPELILPLGYGDAPSASPYWMIDSSKRKAQVHGYYDQATQEHKSLTLNRRSLSDLAVALGNSDVAVLLGRSGFPSPSAPELPQEALQQNQRIALAAFEALAIECAVAEKAKPKSKPRSAAKAPAEPEPAHQPARSRVRKV